MGNWTCKFLFQSLLSALNLDKYCSYCLTPNNYYYAFLQYTKWKIPDATWLPNLQEAVEIPVELTGCRDCGTKTIVVYCKSGGRSAAAIEHLQSLGGFEDVTVYNGMGVVQWTDAGYDLVSTDSATPAGCNVDDCPVNNAAEDPEDVESTNNSTTTALPADASSAGILDGASRIILVVLPAAIIVATVGAVW